MAHIVEGIYRDSVGVVCRGMQEMCRGHVRVILS